MKERDLDRIRQLATEVVRRAPLDAAMLLDREDDDTISAVLGEIDPNLAVRIVSNLPDSRQRRLPIEGEAQIWQKNLSHPPDSVGRLMESADALLSRDMTVEEAIDTIRPFAIEKQLVYAYVVDDNEQLEGLITMRDLLFARPGAKVSDIMVIHPFFFTASTNQDDAARSIIQRHYPVYPVCDDDGRLLGVLRGYAIFENQTVQLTAQAGQMVGVEKEEHISTSWFRSLTLRHPWLQLNLLTAFVAGAVVGIFEDTIAQVVTLAAFLPVLAGQAGNTGCQALAVTLRSMTLDELKPGMEGGILRKETLLGMFNGLLVGLTAGVAMLAYAWTNSSADPLLLAGIVLLAMVGSCTAAGISGVAIPLILRRLGADPATASTIFLTTATDVVSMGALLGLATLIIL